MNKKKLIAHIDAICEVDLEVRQALSEIGYPAPRVRPAGFETLLSTIVGQQISTEAAAAIMQRIRALLPSLRADDLMQLPSGSLREAGLSGRKVEYAEGLAAAIVDGSFDVDGLSLLNDEDAIEAMTSIRGFGVWSAEIYLMFSLDREDIFPANDLALQVALQRLKGLEHRPSEKQSRRLIEHWSAHRSAGSLFLWHYYRGAPT